MLAIARELLASPNTDILRGRPSGGRPGGESPDQEPAARTLQGGGLAGDGFGIYHAKCLHSDLSIGLPKFENPFSRHDLPWMVEHEFAVRRDADCGPNGIFALVMSNATYGVEHARFRKAGYNPYLYGGFDRSAGDDVAQPESQCSPCRNGRGALNKRHIPNFRDRAKGTFASLRAATAGLKNSALQH